MVGAGRGGRKRSARRGPPGRSRWPRFGARERWGHPPSPARPARHDVALAAFTPPARGPARFRPARSRLRGHLFRLPAHLRLHDERREAGLHRRERAVCRAPQLQGRDKRPGHPHSPDEHGDFPGGVRHLPVQHRPRHRFVLQPALLPGQVPPEPDNRTRGCSRRSRARRSFR